MTRLLAAALLTASTLASTAHADSRPLTPRRELPLRLVRPSRSVQPPPLVQDGKTGGDSRPFDRHLWRAEARSGVSMNLLRAVIRVESNFNPRAISPVGAKGLMQLMPLTARLFGVRDVFDPGENILAGARYLGELASSFRGDLVLTLAAYHAGPTQLQAGLNSPVTRAYVQRVLAEYARLTAQSLTPRRGL